MDAPEWYRKRTYLHFDHPLGPSQAEKIATDPTAVSKHSFYPFISYSIFSSKVAKVDGKLIPLPKARPISYAAHADSHIYSYYCSLLSDPYEKWLLEAGLSSSVLAFRKLGKNNIDFAHEAFTSINTLGTDLGSCTAMAFDISGFFDNLNHEILKERWAKLLGAERLPTDHFAVYKSLTRYAKVDRDALYSHLGLSTTKPARDKHRLCSPQEFREKVRGRDLVEVHPHGKGIPQGSPISALLSNVYMYEFDLVLAKFTKDREGHYFRYCDDMLFILPTRFSGPLEQLIDKELQNLRIEINPKKTEKRVFTLHNGKLKADKPLQYLGFLYNGESIVIRSSALTKHSRRMRRGVRLAKKTKIKRNRQKLLQGNKPTKLYRRKLYERYSHLGKRNFITYAIRAADKMDSRSIRKQIKPLWERLHTEIAK